MQPDGAPDGQYFVRAVTFICSPSIWIVNGVPDVGAEDSFTSKLHVVGPLLFLWKENGLVTCLRAATNEQLWSERVEGPFYGSPVAVNGYLYNMTTRGDLIVLAAAEKFAPPIRIALGEGSHATPAVSGGRMYLRTFTHLMALPGKKH